jgi:polyhydroxyalkanoate synthesis regulator phasin
VNGEQSVLKFLVLIIILEALFFIGSVVPLQALSKEGQLLNNHNNPQGFEPYVNGGNEGINSLLLESVLTTDIYDDVPIIKISTATQENSSSTSNTGTITSNASSTGIDEQNKLINELVNTGKLTEKEAKEIIARVMLINELVQSGKFTEEEAKEFVTNVMNNGTDEANVTDGVNVPEVPEANLTTTVPEVPEVPEANLTTTVPEVPEVPEANLTTTVPLENNTGLVNLKLGVKQNPISSGEEQTVTLVASDPITGAPLDRIFVHLTIKDPAGNIVKDYTDNDGQLSPTFLINEGEVGTFTVLGTALQAGVESIKSLTFQVQ